MEFEALKALVLLAEHRSVSRVAKELGVSRATVRRRITELEEVVGVPLLRPASQGIVPTEAGLVLAERGRPVLAEIDGIVETVKACGDTPQGRVRLVVPVGMHPNAVVMFARMMRSTWPGVQVDVRHHEHPLRCLSEDVDLLLSFDLRVPEGPWEVIDLVSMDERLLATRSYVEQHGPYEDIADLEGEDLMVWRAPDCDPRLLPTRDGGHVAITPAIVSTELHHVHTLMRSGHGIAFVADAELAGMEQSSEEVVQILGDRIGRRRPFRLLVPPMLSASPKLEAIVQVLRSFSGMVQRVQRPSA